MFEGFDKLPQFLQLCIGLGCAIGAAYAIIMGLKARKFFKPERTEDEGSKLEEDIDKLANDVSALTQELSQRSRKIYERIEDFDKHVDLRYDTLEMRVRNLEISFAEFKGRNTSRR